MASVPRDKFPSSDGGEGAQVAKKSKEDFTFDKILGEGSYSTVVLATEKATKRQFAVKILDKRHIIREKKVQCVSREKDVLTKLDHPFFVKLYFTFQDTDNLWFTMPSTTNPDFGLSLCKRGELLDYLKKVGSFDENATQFYAAEIVLALEHLHGKGIIHRDLKPENILLGEDMHIQITDFGTAKIMQDENDRANSFVGTAEYVSPELLQNKVAYKRNEYLCFQKIIKLEYEIPEGFPDMARDLVTALLVLDYTKRLGCEQMGGYGPLKDHGFFEDIDWDDIPSQTPPKLLPYLPSTTQGEQGMHSDYNVGAGSGDTDFEDRFLQCFGLGDPDFRPKTLSSSKSQESDRNEKLKKQTRESPWHQFVNNELIVKCGLVDKRKGLFSKRRQLILTDAPRLYYVDPVAMVLKGEIPWSSQMRIEVKNWKIFFVHTPNRTYYLEDPTGQSQEWVDIINLWIENSKASSS